MADKTTPFVVNDRRKFTAEGELRPGVEIDTPARPETKSERGYEDRSEDEPASKAPTEPITFPASPSEEPSRSEDEPVKHSPEPITFPSSTSPSSTSQASEDEDIDDDQLPAAPSAEQAAQASRAYAATVDRLDVAIRATNPGMERTPEMSFDRFVQSLYMQAIIQLGGGAEPGQTPQVDILGARQTIDMLNILSEKTKGNLSSTEDKLLQSALFEAQMGFLEVTQALARQTAARQPGGVPGAPGSYGGPSIVR